MSRTSKFLSLSIPVPLVYFTLLHIELSPELGHVLASPVRVLLEFDLEQLNLLQGQAETPLLRLLSIVADFVLEDLGNNVIQVDFALIL